MLKNVLHGTERTSLLLIQDSSDCHGSNLFKSYLQQNSQKRRVTLVLFESAQDSFCEELHKDVFSNLTVRDFSCDPYGWRAPDQPHLCSTPLAELLGLCSDDVIFIDSLSACLIATTPAQVCRQLLALKQQDKQVVAMIHSDLHSEHDLELVTHMATCLLQMEEPKSDDCNTACQLLLKRYSGKVVKQHQELYVTRCLDIPVMRDVVALNSNKQPGSTEQTNEPDPTANLTFNLRLSETEKQARHKTTAPYLKAKGERDQLLGQPRVESRVFYQPDDADDFDEEDPDDDLDI